MKSTTSLLGLIIISQVAGKGPGGGPNTWHRIVTHSAFDTFKCFFTTWNLSHVNSEMGKGKLHNGDAMATANIPTPNGTVPKMPAHTQIYTASSFHGRLSSFMNPCQISPNCWFLFSRNSRCFHGHRSLFHGQFTIFHGSNLSCNCSHGSTNQSSMKCCTLHFTGLQSP